jgi:hypothetical protein
MHANDKIKYRERMEKVIVLRTLCSIYLVSQRRPLAQLDDPFAVLASTSS